MRTTRATTGLIIGTTGPDLMRTTAGITPAGTRHVTMRTTRATTGLITGTTRPGLMRTTAAITVGTTAASELTVVGTARPSTGLGADSGLPKS